jgi:hypothetical protein
VIAQEAAHPKDRGRRLHDDVGRLVPDQPHCGRSIAGGQDLETFAGQVSANEFDQRRLVIDDEDAMGSVSLHVRRVWEKLRERKDRGPGVPMWALS